VFAYQPKAGSTVAKAIRVPVLRVGHRSAACPSWLVSRFGVGDRPGRPAQTRGAPTSAPYDQLLWPILYYYKETIIQIGRKSRLKRIDVTAEAHWY